MINIILSIIGISLLLSYLLTYGDVMMVLNIHHPRIAVFHEMRKFHFYPGGLTGMISLAWSLYTKMELFLSQKIFIGILGFILFLEVFGFPAIFRPINYPNFLSYDDVTGTVNEYLDDDLIAVTIDDTVRIYPIQPLRMNHIVNDNFNGRKIAVTHCALCKTSVVYSRNVNGDEVSFTPTTSTNESNLIFYDNKGNYWQQISGQMLNSTKDVKLTKIPNQIIKRHRIPQLIEDGYNVQVMDYEHKGRKKFASKPFNRLMKFVDDPTKKVIFPVSRWDERLERKVNVVGIHDGEENFAIPIDYEHRIKKEVVVNGKSYFIEVDNERGEYSVIGLENSSQTKTDVIFPVYWFAWATRYLKTEIILI